MEMIVFWLVAAWPHILMALGGLSAAATAVTRMTETPADDAWAKKFAGFLSWLEHRDVGGTKIPGVPTRDNKDK